MARSWLDRITEFDRLSPDQFPPEDARHLRHERRRDALLRLRVQVEGIWLDDRSDAELEKPTEETSASAVDSGATFRIQTQNGTLMKA